ncbi:MAG TPA: hypothetical protein VFE04_11910 [Puia sp.]|nr:hypothetical protein [Puia sp.]
MLLDNGLHAEILFNIASVAGNEELFDEKNFILRTKAMDQIEFHVIDRLEFLPKNTDTFDRDKLNDLKLYAEKVGNQLIGVNRKMYHRLRSEISKASDKGKLLMKMMEEYLDQPAGLHHSQNTTGYDYLDLFINGLLTYRELPAETKERETGMVYYQKTPVRIVFEMINNAAFKRGDVFYDLGSGLGQVTILVNLLTSVTSKGVEYEPAYCEYSKTVAADLNLGDVEFINADARYADYSSGTVFFMYTPFEGKILGDVLNTLNAESKKRKIKIITYGPCTKEVARTRWLRQVSNMKDYNTAPNVFVSL